jgi:hypothetical protein
VGQAILPVRVSDTFTDGGRMASRDTRDGDAIGECEREDGARRSWRCPPEARDADGEPTDDWIALASFEWHVFALRLGRVLRGMRGGDRLIVADTATGDFVQFARERGWFAEARSNQYIEGWYEPLTVADAAVLRAFGWRPPALAAAAIGPEGLPLGRRYSPNWSRRATVAETEALADTAAATLAWGYRTGLPGTLRIEAFNMRDRPAPDISPLTGGAGADGADDDDGGASHA